MYDIDNHNKIKEFLLISNFTPLDTAMYNLKSSLRENKIDINRNMNFKNSQNTLLFIIFIFNITNVLKTFYKNNFFNKKNNSLVLSERIYNYFHCFWHIIIIMYHRSTKLAQNYTSHRFLVSSNHYFLVPHC